MAANGFSSMVFTDEGRNLLAKAQTGTQLQFTRIAVGDGILNGQDSTKFTHLINEVMSLNISELINGGGGSATIETVLSNANLTTGFYWREIGVFATDPQLGEILYGYDNANGGEIYVPDKSTNVFTAPLNINVYISNSANVTAVIDSSLVYAKKSDVDAVSTQLAKLDESLAKVAKTNKYGDLDGLPTIPAAQVQTDWNAKSGMGVLLHQPAFETVATNILPDGTAAAGASGKLADAAHVHPTDTSRAEADLVPQTLVNTSPAFPTGTSDTNPTPINFRDGSALEVAAQGATFNQIIQNGNFVKDSNADGLADSFTLTGANPVSCTGNTQAFIATQQWPQFDSAVIPIASHRYFLTAMIKATSNLVYLEFVNGMDHFYRKHSGDGQYHVLGFIVDVPSSPSGQGFYITDGRTSGWDNISVQDFMAVDMGTADNPTPYYNFTDTRMLNLIGNGYFEGLTPVTNPTWLSTRKNLINIPNGDISCFNTIVIGNGNTLTSDSGYFKYANSSGTKGDVESTYVVTHVFPGITYNCKLTYKTDGNCETLSLFVLIELNNSGNFYDCYYSANFNNSITDSVANLQFTAPTGATRMIVRVDNYGTAGTLWFKNIMVTSDLSAEVEYEPYKSSQLTVNASFGTGDTLTIRDGYAYKNGFPVPFTGYLKAHQGGQISVSNASGVLPLSTEYIYTNRLTPPTVFSGTPYAGTTTHSGNAYAINYPGYDYIDGCGLLVKFDADSTGAATLSVNGGTAIPIVDSNNLPVLTIKSGMFAVLRYNSTNANFQLTGKGGIPNVTAGSTVGLMPWLGGEFVGSSTESTQATEVFHETIGNIMGSIRVTMCYYSSLTNHTATVFLAKNGVQVCPAQSTSDTYTHLYTTDITGIKPGDRISAYASTDASGGTAYGGFNQASVNEQVNPIY